MVDSAGVAWAESTSTKRPNILYHGNGHFRLGKTINIAQMIGKRNYYADIEILCDDTRVFFCVSEY
jgi:hypothetical protein